MFSERSTADVEQDVGKILVGDDRAIQREDEGLLAKARNVLQDAPQVGWFHFGLWPILRAQISIQFAAGFNINFNRQNLDVPFSIG